MKWEKTPTYFRIYLGSVMIQINRSEKDKIKRRSVKACCKMIGLAQQLTPSDIRQMRDYLDALGADANYNSTQRQ